MELQWPLIIFTTLVAWSAGLFATQCVCSLKGEAAKAQMPAWITSAVLLVVGGVAVFFHLEHWERIFNGFGHLTSGITQELIAIVVLAVVALVYLVLLRKSEGGKLPAWICVAGIVVAVVLVAVMAHSYIMAARPAWDSSLWIVYVLGNACALGPLTMALIVALTEGEGAVSNLGALLAVGGSAVGVAGAVAYGAIVQVSGGSFSSIPFYFDPVHPAKAMVDAAGVVGSQALLIWGAAVILGALAPLGCALFGKKKGSWKIAAGVGVACAVVGAVCMRVAFYNAGLSVFSVF